MIPDPALMAVFLADLAHSDREQTGPLPSVIAVRLIDKGYPAIVAGRVALTPTLTVPGTPSADDDSRPGRDLAVAVLRLTPAVVRTLIRSAVWP